MWLIFKDGDYLSAASDEQGNMVLKKSHPIADHSLPESCQSP